MCHHYLVIGVGEVRILPGRRHTLVRVAARHFGAAGYDGASLNAIIRECRISKSSFYQSVPSKAALFDLVVTDLSATIAAAVAVPDPRHFSGSGFWTKVGEFVDRLGMTAAAVEELSWLGPLVHLGGLPTEARATVDRWRRPVDAWIVAVLAEGRAGGQVRADLPADLQARLVLEVLHTLDAWAVTHGPTGTAEVDVGKVVELLHRMVGAD